MGIEDLDRRFHAFRPRTFDRFSARFEEFVTDQWDRQIERDINAGRLGAAGKGADEDFLEAGRCIPSKLLIGYADAAECARAARRFGFETTVRTPDPDAILRDTFEFTNKYDGILENALGKNVTLYRNHAAFTANRTLQVNNNLISADRVALATGSRPQRPALDVPYWTSDEVFTLKKMSKSITILGGGYIACELGHFFHGVGAETPIVVRRDQLLDREDAETRAVFMKGFTERVFVTFNSTIA